MTRACHVYLVKMGEEPLRCAGVPRRATDHPFVRHLLRAHSRVRSEDFAIDRDAHGRPYLVDCNKNLAFNLSHSGAFTVLAVIEGGIVGVDAEQDAPVDDLDDMAAIVLQDEEQRFLNSVSPDCRARRFLEIWVRKEAVLKAMGIGISGDARRVRVANRRGWLPQAQHPDCGAPFFVQPFSSPGVQGAVASDIVFTLDLHMGK